jgi:uncharacterized RDD family membrane protein YckC
MEEEKKDEIQLDQNEQLQQIIQSADEVVSGEQIVAPLTPLEYAGFWVRFAALLVDGLVLLIPTFIINMITGKEFFGTILMWIYMIYMINTKQATLGKMAVGIKVISLDGTNLSLGKIVLRETLGKFISGIILGIGYIMAGFTEKKQGLHDMMASTVVVYDSSRERRKWLVVLGVIVGMIVPVGILLSVVLVSLGSAKQKALDTKVKQEQVMKDLQQQRLQTK